MTGSAKLAYAVLGWSMASRVRSAESMQISVPSGA
jgi:hypothetical protein